MLKQPLAVCQPLATAAPLSVAMDLPVVEISFSNGIIDCVAFVSDSFHLALCSQGSPML